MKSLFAPLAFLLAALFFSLIIDDCYPAFLAVPSVQEQVNGTALAGWGYMCVFGWLMTGCQCAIFLSSFWLCLRSVKLVFKSAKEKYEHQ